MARSHMLFLKEICGPGERPDFSRTGPEKSNPRSGQQHDEGSVCPDREVLAKRPHTTLSKHVLRSLHFARTHICSTGTTALSASSMACGSPTWKAPAPRGDVPGVGCPDYEQSGNCNSCC